MKKFLTTTTSAAAANGRRFLASSASAAQEFVCPKGLKYRVLPRDYDPEALFAFNKTHGATPLNFIPDEPVRAHFAKLASGETTIWAAFQGEELAGFISGELGGGYWLELQDGKAPDKMTCFINEFVVNPNLRGMNVGTNLTRMSIDSHVGIFGLNEEVNRMYTTVHVENVASRTAFIKGGYSEVLTYKDAMRERSTTVLAANRPAVQEAMRVVGVQSGNAVDGIDVGIFDFQPVQRSPVDPRILAAPLKYKVLANKTFPFTPEQREYVLGLRAMDRKNGNDYAEGNYTMGEWCAANVNSLISEQKLDKKSIHLIGSHGQTVSGHPHWEFGDLSVIAQHTGITVAGDFRPADVAAGGNGTPCTCTYDSIMLRPTEGEKWRIAINIGGTSSVSFLPPLAHTEAVPHGLDPGLGVFFMDLTVNEIDPTMEFDDDGKMARGGTVNEQLLAEFLEYKYYKQPNLPIGVGPDDFPETLFHKWHARAQELGVSNQDLLTTFTELTAKQIALACQRFGGEHINNGNCEDVIMRGGVTHNSFFMERLKAQMQLQIGGPVTVRTLDAIGLEEASWENAMYAMFGYLCFNNVYNFVPSCTGATRKVVGGRIAPGENFKSVSLLNY